MTIAPVGASADYAAGNSKRADDRQQLFGRLIQALEKDMWQSAAAGPLGSGKAHGVRNGCGIAGSASVLRAAGAAAAREQGGTYFNAVPISERGARQQEKGAAIGAKLERVGSESAEPYARSVTPLVRSTESPCLTLIRPPPTIDALRVRWGSALAQDETSIVDDRGTPSHYVFETPPDQKSANVVTVEVHDGSISVCLQSLNQNTAVVLKRELLGEIHRQGLTCRRLVVNADASDFTVIKELDHAC